MGNTVNVVMPSGAGTASGVRFDHYEHINLFVPVHKSARFTFIYSNDNGATFFDAFRNSASVPTLPYITGDNQVSAFLLGADYFREFQGVGAWEFRVSSNIAQSADTTFTWHLK